MVKRWIDANDIKTFTLNNKEKEYEKLMISIPNFDKTEVKKRKKSNRKRK